MKVLITGASGAVGRYMARRYAGLGHIVIGTYWSNRPENAVAGVEYRKADLGEPILHLPKCDLVIHTAVRNRFTPGSTVADYARVNVLGAHNLCQYALQSRVGLLVNLSTISVFGDRPGVSHLEEESPFFSPGPYGASKFLGELTFAEIKETVACTSIRLPGVIGPGYFESWLGKTVSRVLRGETIRIYNPETPFNNVIDLEEICRLVDWLFERRSSLSLPAALHLAGSEPVRLGELVNRILSKTRSTSSLQIESGPPSFTVGTGYLEQKAGYRPASVTAMVDRFVEEAMVALQSGKV